MTRSASITRIESEWPPKKLPEAAATRIPIVSPFTPAPGFSITLAASPPKRTEGRRHRITIPAHQRIGKGDASCADEHLAVAGLECGDLDAFKDLGTALAAHMNGFHDVPRSKTFAIMEPSRNVSTAARASAKPMPNTLADQPKRSKIQPSTTVPASSPAK